MSQTTDQIDAAASALWAGVVFQQDAYRAANGAYYQMLWTHSEPPTAATAPDSLNERPTDQPASPIQGLPATMRSRMRIDTYGQPDGWTMTLEASIDGEVWQRSIDCGTDLGRNSEWQIVPLTVPPAENPPTQSVLRFRRKTASN
jgi:hypothetical protein